MFGLVVEDELTLDWMYDMDKKQLTLMPPHSEKPEVWRFAKSNKARIAEAVLAFLANWPRS